MQNKTPPTYLITGATGHLGRALSLLAASQGARLILLGRKPDALMALADEIVAQGGTEPLLHAIDFAGAQAEDYSQLAELLRQHTPQLNALLHLAADIAAPAPLAHVDPSIWNRVLRVNLTAPFLLTRACLPLLLAAQGRVMFMGDHNPASYLGAYAVSKAGLEQQARQWADEQPELQIEIFIPPPMPTPLYARIFPGKSPEGLTPVAQVAQEIFQRMTNG
ncbi:MAG: SDR family NAD(P)-dependent oxidoreductase [Halothiobacillaceae bacterium]